MTTDGQPTPAQAARDHLTTIRNGWRHVLDPIKVQRGGTIQTSERPATEDELDLPPDARLDTPITLAFWVHAAIDEWPTILQTLEEGPDGNLRLETTKTVDCGNVYAMADFLDEQADRLAAWVDDTGHDYGATFVDELAAAARAVSKVAWPPKGDRMVIGDCPACFRRLRIKAPAWRQDEVPQPTTDPAAYPAWTVLPGATWRPDRDKPIACRCGREDTFDGWRDAIAGPSLKLTAKQLVADIRAQFGMRYEPVTIRTLARRGLFKAVDYDERGQALYDRTQVLAALMARERLALEERSA